LNHSQIARRTVAEQDLIVKAGLLACKQVAVKIRGTLLNRVLRGQSYVNSGDLIVPRMGPILRDAMVASHLMGAKLTRDLQAEQGLMLSQKSIKKIIDKLGDPATIKKLTKDLDTTAFKVMTGVSNKVDAKLRDTVNKLILKGTPPGKGVKELNKAFESVGLKGTSENVLATALKTQSAIVYNAAKWEEDQDPDIQEILWGYTYTTAGDDRVRETHAALEGITLPKDDPFWKKFWPPNGYNCRCTVIPIYETTKIVRKKLDGIEPDAGFDFNPGEVLALSQATYEEILYALAL
jgi:SPP1 gp7 family putative phage head morphogenesis protein